MRIKSLVICDASNYALCEILQQRIDNKEMSICYDRKVLDNELLKCMIMEKRVSDITQCLLNV